MHLEVRRLGKADKRQSWAQGWDILTIWCMQHTQVLQGGLVRGECYRHARFPSPLGRKAYLGCVGSECPRARVPAPLLRVACIDATGARRSGSFCDTDTLGGVSAVQALAGLKLYG